MTEKIGEIATSSNQKTVGPFIMTKFNMNFPHQVLL